MEGLSTLVDKAAGCIPYAYYLYSRKTKLPALSRFRVMKFCLTGLARLQFTKTLYSLTLPVLCGRNAHLFFEQSRKIKWIVDAQLRGYFIDA